MDAKRQAQDQGEAEHTLASQSPIFDAKNRVEPRSPQMTPGNPFLAEDKDDQQTVNTLKIGVSPLGKQQQAESSRNEDLPVFHDEEMKSPELMREPSHDNEVKLKE